MNHEKCKIQTAVEAVRKQALSECRTALNNAASALGELGIVSTFSMVANHDGDRLKILIDHIVNGSVSVESSPEAIAPNARIIRAKLFDALVEMPLGMLAALATDQAVPFNEDKAESFLEKDSPKKEKKFARKLVGKLLDLVSPIKLQAWLAYNGEVIDFFEEAEPSVEDELFNELMEFPLFYLSQFAEETSQAANIPVLDKLLKAGNAIGDDDSERLQEHKQKLARCLSTELPLPLLDVWITENESLKEDEVFAGTTEELAASNLIGQLSKFSLADLKVAADEFGVKIHKLQRNKVDDAQLACAIAVKLVKKVGVSDLLDWIDEFNLELQDEDEADRCPKAQTPADVLVSNLKATHLNTLCAHFNLVPKTKRVVKGVPVPTKQEMADAILAKHKPKKVEAALVELHLPQFKL